jgi:hypothetical protein
MLLTLRETSRLPERAAVRVSRGGPLRGAWERKRAFGEHDRSLAGYLALVVGTPLRLARNATSAVLPGPGRREAVDVVLARAADDAV